MKSVPQTRTLTDSTFFITSNLDGEKCFVDEANARIVLNTLDFYRKRGDILLYGFVVMPDHIHLLLNVNAPTTLPRFMNGLKSYIANQLGNRSIWQKSYWSELITNEHHFAEKLNYIHANPVRTNIVQSPEEFMWSSARDYLDGNANGRIDCPEGFIK